MKIGPLKKVLFHDPTSRSIVETHEPQFSQKKFDLIFSSHAPYYYTADTSRNLVNNGDFLYHGQFLCLHFLTEADNQLGNCFLLSF